ncbi:hypothetical protein PFLUV_G00160470 [Perca fluviatilis]|uniref:SEA domain-containing protein n=1 Tax=Perca fluviatilis TaxID=8168 RepID=A0A6A5E0T8_PERFL|nr:hypothetical protein PFLUV_G00160470 [Perca fluviatilis]
MSYYLFCVNGYIRYCVFSECHLSANTNRWNYSFNHCSQDKSSADLKAPSQNDDKDLRPTSSVCWLWQRTGHHNSCPSYNHNCTRSNHSSPSSYHSCPSTFQNRAALIKEQLEPFFQRTYSSSFRSLTVVSFRSGSVINTMDLSFVSTIAPNNTQIGSTLINAASSVSGFDIESSSITVNGISSGGVSHKISLVTASCLVLLSWLL